MKSKADIQDICERILDAGGLAIHDVEKGEPPFLYSSGNRGPGYVMIKGLVGQPDVLLFLVRQLALKLLGESIAFEFIAANATGGIIPGWQLRNDLEAITGRKLPYVYVRESRKQGGHKEQVTGAMNNPLLAPGQSALIVEELVNFAQTTCNSALLLRQLGYRADEAAAILDYQHPKGIEQLQKSSVRLTSLVTMEDLLSVAEMKGKFERRLIESYRAFLVDPVKWQEAQGLGLPLGDA